MSDADGNVFARSSGTRHHSYLALAQPPVTAEEISEVAAAARQLGDHRWQVVARALFIAWDLLDYRDVVVPDLTRGLKTWPYMCAARRPGPDVPRMCTRRAGHTGRHAAGNGTQIVAVWGAR